MTVSLTLLGLIEPVVLYQPRGIREVHVILCKLYIKINILAKREYKYHNDD